MRVLVTLFVACVERHQAGCRRWRGQGARVAPAAALGQAGHNLALRRGLCLAADVAVPWRGVKGQTPLDLRSQQERVACAHCSRPDDLQLVQDASGRPILPPCQLPSSPRPSTTAPGSHAGTARPNKGVQLFGALQHTGPGFQPDAAMNWQTLVGWSSSHLDSPRHRGTLCQGHGPPRKPQF